MHGALGDAFPRDWVVFAHVASVLAFALAHGASLAAMSRLKREKDLPRVAALLDLSRATLLPSNLALASVAATGLLAASLTHAWARGWLWLSLATLASMVATLWRLAVAPMHAMRRAAGLAFREGGRWQPPRAVDLASLSLARHALRARSAAAASLAGLAIILWAMTFRPF